MVAALVAALAIAVAACGSSSSSSSGGSSSSSSGTAEASGPFKILAVMPISGPLAAVGATESTGMKAAIQVINEEGGILGHKVQVKFSDAAGSGSKAVSIATSEGEGYNLISCGSFGEEAVPCAEALVTNSALQIPLAAEEELNQPEALPNVYQAQNLFNAPEQAMAEQMQAKGIKKFAIVVGDNTTGHLSSKILEQEGQKVGLEPTGTVFVPEGATDATPQVQQAEASGAEALAITGFTPANGPILAAKKKLGWSVPVFGDVYFSAANLALLVKPDQYKEITLEAYPWMVKDNPATKTPEFNKFWSTVLKLEPEQVLSDIAPLVAYQAPMLARAAAEKAGSIEGAAMAEAMAEVTDASQVKGWVGPAKIYASDRHYYGQEASEFAFVNPGAPTVNGILTP